LRTKTDISGNIPSDAIGLCTDLQRLQISGAWVTTSKRPSFEDGEKDTSEAADENYHEEI
jgi:hypothetical protein